MAQVLEITHPRLGNLYIVRIDGDRAVVYVNNGTDTEPNYSELASVEFHLCHINWYSGGSQTGVREARQMGEALDIAEAVVAMTQATVNYTRETLQTMLDFVLE